MSTARCDIDHHIRGLFPAQRGNGYELLHTLAWMMDPAAAEMPFTPTPGDEVLRRCLGVLLADDGGFNGRKALAAAVEASPVAINLPTPTLVLSGITLCVAAKAW